MTSIDNQSVRIPDQAAKDFNRFIRILFSDSEPTFQTFPEINGDATPAKVFHGDNHTNRKVLSTQNARGQGCFVMVNEGDGVIHEAESGMKKPTTCRNAHNVLRVRAFFADLDGSPLQPVLDTGLLPHIIVETSPKRYHAYWLVSDAKLDQFKPLQISIAERFSGDKSVCDLPRVMRLPGFIHQKKEPFLTQIIDAQDNMPAYTVQQIIDGLGLDVKDQKNESINGGQTKSIDGFMHGSAKGGRTINITKVARSQSRHGFTVEETIAFCLTHDRMHNRPPLEETEPGKIEATVRDIYERYAKHDADAPDFVMEMNELNFVSVEGGRTAVFSERNNHELRTKELVRLSFQSFRDFYDNQKVEIGNSISGTPVKKGKGSAWLLSEHRRQYDGVTLEPDEEKLPPNYMNLWKGFGVKPVKGDWSLMKKHLYSVICSNNVEYFQYLIAWFAFCVQNPSELPGVAPVLQGGKGVGKGFVGMHFCKLIGRNHSLHITNAKHLIGGFNSHLRGRLFLFADEACYAGDRQNESVLKGLITEPTITIEGKGRDAVQARNMLHVLMASNSDWVVPASGDERRYFVLKVSDKHAQDAKYFEPAYKQMENGGLEAWLHDLLGYDLTDFDIRKVPQTDALRDQKLLGLDAQNSWWYQILYNGVMPGEGKWGEILKHQFFDDYLAAVGLTRNRSHETAFWMRMRVLLPPGYVEKKRSRSRYQMGPSKGQREGSQVVYSHFPDLEVCRQHFETNIVKTKIVWLI